MAVSRLHVDNSSADRARQAFRAVRETPRFERLLVRMATLAHRETPARSTYERVAQAEPALNARSLRLLSSGVPGNPPFAVSSIPEAVERFGHEACIRASVFSSLEAFCAAAFLGPVLKPRAFLRHALASAVVTGHVADLAQLDAHQGWLIGLLHNLGSPVTAAHSPQDYDAACTGLAGSSAQVQDAERSTFGYDHTDMGGVLIEDLPWMPALGVAMAHHHRADATKPPALAAGAASTIAHQLGFDMGLANTPPELGQTEMVRFALVGPELDKVVGMVMSAVSVYDQTP